MTNTQARITPDDLARIDRGASKRFGPIGAQVTVYADGDFLVMDDRGITSQHRIALTSDLERINAHVSGYVAATLERVEAQRVGRFPLYLDRDEAQIMNRVITAILKHPAQFTVTVWDGEEQVTETATRKRQTIQSASGHTGVTTYHLADATGRAGALIFIHGNGEDVLSDFSWPQSRPECEAILDAISNAAQQ